MGRKKKEKGLLLKEIGLPEEPTPEDIEKNDEITEDLIEDSKEENNHPEKIPGEKYSEIVSAAINEAGTSWKTNIVRLSPNFVETSEGTITLKLGQIAKFQQLLSVDEAEEVIRKNFGGGRYSCALVKAGKIRRVFTVEIDDIPPIPTPLEKVGIIRHNAKMQAAGEEDRVKQLQKEKDAEVAAFDLEKTKAELDKKRKRMQENNEDDDDEDRKDNSEELTFQPPVDPTIIEEQIRKQILAEVENRELKVKLASLEAKLEAMIDAKTKQDSRPGMTAQDWISTIGVGLGAIKGIIESVVSKVADKKERDPVADFIKMAEAMGLNKPKENDNSKFLETGMSLLTSQLKAGMEASTSMQIQGMKTAMDMIRNSISEGRETPEDWKLGLGKKLLEAGQLFTKELFDFNKQKLDIEKAKVAFMGNRKKLSAGTPVKPQGASPVPASEVLDKPQETPPVFKAAGAPPEETKKEDELVKKLQQQGQKLMQAAVGAFMTQVPPEVFAAETERIGGREIAEWLAGDEANIESLGKIADAAGYGEQFTQHVMGNPAVRTWIEQWVAAIKGSRGEPEEEDEAAGFGADFGIDVEDATNNKEEEATQ